jgi:hypothetical protein
MQGKEDRFVEKVAILPARAKERFQVEMII